MTGSKAPGTIGGKWDEAEETAELTMADKKSQGRSQENDDINLKVARQAVTVV